MTSHPQSSSTSSPREPRTMAETTEKPRRTILPLSMPLQPDGESGRSGIHPLQFLRICMRSGNKISAAVNILWPFVPAAFIVYYVAPHNHELDVYRFALAYIGMVPCANLLGFAGQELARKLPKVLGVVLENMFGATVELILFWILVLRSNESNTNIAIIKDAILGSILANLLLCLGLCFFVGGLRHSEQSFHGIVSEVGNGLMLVAGMLLVIPAAFAGALSNSDRLLVDTDHPYNLNHYTLQISRATSILLLVAFCLYLRFQFDTHHSIFSEILEADEERDRDRERDLRKAKLTFAEAIFAVVLSITLVTFMAFFLVKKIHYVVEERHVKDAFVGLILLPVVEKAAEHLTAIDEAWDDQMNFALAHVMGASVATALLNAPLVVIVGWIAKKPMDLQFETFYAIMLILAILVVGNFLRDGKSNHLEGFLCVVAYVAIAIVAFWYPNPVESTGNNVASNTTAAPGR